MHTENKLSREVLAETTTKMAIGSVNLIVGGIQHSLNYLCPERKLHKEKIEYYKSALHSLRATVDGFIAELEEEQNA